MALKLVALLFILLLFPAQRRDDGGVWEQPNKNPQTLKESDVDTLMWPIVKKINESGWVWTTESCQGHPNGYPLTLGVVTSNPGRWFTLLSNAHKKVAPSDVSERQDPHGLPLEIAFWVRPQIPLGSTQIRVSVPSPTNWTLALAVLTELVQHLREG